MALSDQERQMLAEIERALIAEDPRFAQQAKAPNESSFSLNVQSIALILLGICFLVGGIAMAQISLWFVILSVVGFLIMFGGGLMGFRNQGGATLRKMKQGGGSNLGARARGASEGGFGDRMEENFRKRFER